MIKEAMFCNICGKHVYENTSISFYIVPDMVPIVDIRSNVQLGKDQVIQKDDTTLCEFCENNVYAILHSRLTKRKLDQGD